MKFCLLGFAGNLMRWADNCTGGARMDFTLNRRQTLMGIGALGISAAFGSPARAATRNLAVLHLASHAPS